MSDPSAFWQYFTSIEQDIRGALRRHDFDAVNTIVEAMAGPFKEAEPELAFELGFGADGALEFCVSPGGVRGNFERAEAMVDAAPALADWRIFAFKRRHAELPGLRIGDVDLTPDKIGFVASPQEHRIDVDLWFDLPETAPEEMLGQLAFLFLDAALGEYDVAMHLGEIGYHCGVNPQACAFADFARTFDDWNERRQRMPA